MAFEWFWRFREAPYTAMLARLDTFPKYPEPRVIEAKADPRKVQLVHGKPQTIEAWTKKYRKG